MGIFAHFIFASRWLQLPIYLGLIVAQGIYAYKFLKSLWHLVTNLGIMDENTIMMAVLNLIDVVMIANLLTMVIIGGYETFVSRLHVNEHPDQPEWLSHVNASVLKVKLSIVHHQHFLHPSAANLPQRRQPDRKTNHVAVYYPHLFPDFRPRYGVNGQNRVRHDT